MINSSNKPLVEFQNLTIKFFENNKEYIGVENLNMTIAKGEKTAIIGESGCGKTITALALMGLLGGSAHITNGKILFDGKEISKMSKRDLNELRGKDIAMIFQEPMTSLNPLIKVGKQIDENILEHSNQTKKEAKKQTINMLKEVGFADSEKIYNVYPHQLSGGMRQRIMIAMALINNPKLIVADEPTTALDATIQAQIMELLKRLNREKGTALLLISHDLGLVNNICEKSYIMYAGHIAEWGKTKDMLNKPMHPYTKGLINSIPSIENKGKPLNSIKGFVPSVEERNNIGCPFADRCEYCKDICKEVLPKTEIIGNRGIKCHLYNEKGNKNEW